MKRKSVLVVADICSGWGSISQHNQSDGLGLLTLCVCMQEKYILIVLYNHVILISSCKPTIFLYHNRTHPGSYCAGVVGPGAGR